MGQAGVDLTQAAADLIYAFNEADWDRFRGVLALLWEDTHTGPMPTPAGTLEPSGAQIRVEASLWARFHGGKAREVHHYLDMLTLLQQIGAIPPDLA